MFRKILIANRGEIACRVIQTARRLGVATVAVYSDADTGAKHVLEADEAVRIGPAPVSDSYLQGAAIIAAAKATGAEAIHPGYGFLSENPDFVDAVNAAELRFIGPSATAIRAMGLKDAAKALMHEAGVPVVPGYHGDNQDPVFLAEQAQRIGYPVLIKARAGGGGKGMRRVDDPTAFGDALDSARREADAAFGDPACLVEKWITAPRHIEIQVFGDDHGEAVHLFERDCSLQRRHQKVIEEAPAPGMTSQMRDVMGAAAVRAAKAIGYSGAGTVEFIVDASDGLKPDGFWFMEMNTRLQVEHPVTEAITGQDLVEWQLRVASGEHLPMKQDDLSINGWSFEARVYAEDVPAGFLPATGHLAHLNLPGTLARVDAGVRAGDDITPFYDPMVAKLTVHGPDRATALNKLDRALSAARIVGTVTNIRFLLALARHDGFAAGDVDTGLIERDLDALTATSTPAPATSGLAAIAGLGLLDTLGSPTQGWRLWAPDALQSVLLHGDDRIAHRVTPLGRGQYDVSGPEGQLLLSVSPEGENRYRVTTDGHSFYADVLRHGPDLSVFAGDDVLQVRIPDPLATDDGGASSDNAVRAAMPGLVKLVQVDAGAAVEKGDLLLILEAMKMEHRLEAPRDGSIKALNVAEGAQVDAGAVLLELEDEDEDE